MVEGDRFWGGGSFIVSDWEPLKGLGVERVGERVLRIRLLVR